MYDPAAYGVLRDMSRRSLSSLFLVALTVSACNSSSVLDPSSASPGPAASAAAGTASAPPSPQPQPGNSKARLQIAPIVGASVEAAGPLMEALQQKARQRGITLTGSSGQSATHVLKGYF